MVELLAKLFLKEKADEDSPEIRQKYGVLCGLAGIIFNVLLALGKFIAGATIGVGMGLLLPDKSRIRTTRSDMAESSTFPVYWCRF